MTRRHTVATTPAAAGVVHVTGAEAVTLLGGADAAEHLSVLSGVAVLVIHDADRAPPIDPRTPHPTCVSVAIGGPSNDGVVSRPGAGTSLTAWADVSVPDSDAASPVAAGVMANPDASITLTQLLRLTEHLPLADALTAEAWTYGLLQSGTEFHRWLASRDRRTRPDRRPAVVVRSTGDHTSIELHRPHARNALNATMRDELVEVLRGLAAGTGPIELRGAGANFCAGGDLDEFGTTSPVTGHLVRATRSVPRALTAVAPRVTAVVHGACIGAGVELPAFAHRVEATPDAWFRLPEIAMGLLPGSGGTASLPRRIGRQRTAWLALTGLPVTAETALAWGLVDAILDGPPPAR